MKTIQKFSDEYLAQCADMQPVEIVQFLDDFRRIQTASQSQAHSKLISIKVPKDLLQVFKTKAKLEKIPYQTQIKILMRQWLDN